MAKKKVIILGAGLAGLSAAWHLKKKKMSCIVLEKERSIGGLCRSKKVNGFTFDCDGHMLHFRHRYVFNLVKSLLGDNLVKHERSAWINFYDRLIRYPFQANLFGLPLHIGRECLTGYLKVHKNKLHKYTNFEDWIRSTFGHGIAKHFMIPYNSKFWTIPLKRLTCDWLPGFIPVPTREQIVLGAKKDVSKQFGYNASFWYPRSGGINELPKVLACGLKDVRTGCRAKRIDLKKKEISLSSGGKEKFDCLISTIPLPEVSRITPDLPVSVAVLFEKLKWNSIFNLNIGLNRPGNHNRHWIYFSDNKLCFFRAGFFNNISSSLVPRGKSSMYIEVAYSRERPLDKKQIITNIIRDLKSVNLISSLDEVCLQDINDIEYGYPIYDLLYKHSRDNAVGFLGENGVISCGRYGSWRYMSMEDAIQDGKRAADEVSKFF